MIYNQNKVEMLRQRYPEGTRICVDSMDDYCPIESGTCGTVEFVDDAGTLHCKFDKGEKSGVILVTEPIAVLTPAKAEVRQQGRRFKLPDEPMFTITVTDRHGVVYCGYIRKLMPLECWRLQGFTDEQLNKVKAVGMSDAQLYKQAGNAVTTNVVEAVARIILETEKGENA